MTVGNLLLDALALERYLAAQSFRKPSDDLLGQWMRCRKTLNRLITDYAKAIARYRILLKKRYLLRIRH